MFSLFWPSQMTLNISMYLSEIKESHNDVSCLYFYAQGCLGCFVSVIDDIPNETNAKPNSV